MDEKARVKQALQTPLVLDEVWQPIATAWFDKWKAYVIYDAVTDIKLKTLHPGPLVNGTLQGRYCGELRRDLVADRDYVLLPEATADLLIKQYGGGPKFLRKVNFPDDSDDRSLGVDLWPVYVILSLYDRSNPTPYHREPTMEAHYYYPSCMKLQEAVEDAARRVFSVDDTHTPTRYWLATRPAPGLSITGGMGRRLTNDMVDWLIGWHVVGSAEMSRRMKDIRGDGDCIELIVEVAPCRDPKPSDWPRFHLLEAWKQGLRIGDMIDARDSQGHFAAATLVHVSEAGDLVVRYWTGGDDELILAGDFDRRIAPLHSQSSDASTPMVDMPAPSTLVWQPIATAWFDKWKAYVNFDAQADVESVGGRHPGPVDNGPLKGPLADDLRRDLVVDRDYVLLPQESADLLLELYSGGPAFPRKVKFADTFNDRASEVDLWPVRVSLYLCDRSHPTPDPLQPLSQRRFFPSGMTLQEAVTLAERHLFHIAMYTPTRCWLHETSPQSNAPASGTGRRLTNDIVEWDGGWHVVGSAAMSRRMKDIRGDGDCIELIIAVAPCPNPKPSDWPRFHLLEAWKRGIRMGDMLDARDSQGHFKAATVAHVSEAGDLVVRYWTGGDDEWILASDFDRRIAPLHSHSSASSVPEVDMTAPSTLVTHPRSSKMPPATSDDGAGGSAIDEDHGASQVAKVWQPIATAWFDKWKAYVNYDDDEQSVGGRHPGPVDNGPLKGAFVDEMRRGLVAERDYVLLPQECAKRLLSQYGGGPSFPRKVKFADDFDDRWMEADLWPVRVNLYLCDRTHPTPAPYGPTCKQHYFPSRMTLEEAVEDVERLVFGLFHIDTNTPTRYWLRETPPTPKATNIGMGRRLTNDVVEWDGDWHELWPGNNRLMKDIRGDSDCVELIVEVANPQPPDWPRSHRLQTWKQGLRVGDMIDACDEQRKFAFAAATVIHVNVAGDLVVRYWAGGKDEWILAKDCAQCIAPLHSHSRDTTVPKFVPAKGSRDSIVHRRQVGVVPNSATAAKWKEQFVFELCSVDLATFSNGTPGSIRGDHLLVKRLPELFRARYGLIPEKIYVRDAYKTLYETAAQTRFRQQTGTYCATLFTGVPGIGTSLFLVYFIYRFLTDESIKDKRFALEFTRGVYVCFEPSGAPGEFWCSSEDGVRMRPKRFLLLCDIDDAAAPVSRAQWTYIFSSPNPARYKEILKNSPSQRFTLPTWSEAELLFVSADIDSWYEDFVLFGGVPRYLFPYGDPSNPSRMYGDPRRLMEKALFEKGGAIAESFFPSGGVSVDSLQSYYMLVHINPPVSTAGEVDYRGVTKYTFASDAVFQRLVQKHRPQLLARATGMFNTASETFGAVFEGHLFEKVCLWLTPLDGTRCTALSLSGGSSAKFEVPPVRELLPHDWKKTARLVPGVLYVPRIISTLESGSAFYLVGLPTGGYQLVVLQMTVGTSHPVKRNGLHAIRLAYADDVRLQVARKALVFVLPANGAREREQALPTRKEETKVDSAHVPVAERGFQQYVYRHTVSEATDVRPTAAATGSLTEPLAQSRRGAAREPTAGRESSAKRSRPAPAGTSKAARTGADR
eukprot:gene3549-2587_t